MIVELLIVLLLGILNSVLGLIPEFTIFSEQNQLTTVSTSEWSNRMGGMLWLWNKYFPVATLFYCLAAVLAARLFVVVAHLMVWVLDKFPFKSS